MDVGVGAKKGTTTVSQVKRCPSTTMLKMGCLVDSRIQTLLAAPSSQQTRVTQDRTDVAMRTKRRSMTSTRSFFTLYINKRRRMKTPMCCGCVYELESMAFMTDDCQAEINGLTSVFCHSKITGTTGVAKTKWRKKLCLRDISHICHHLGRSLTLHRILRRSQWRTKGSEYIRLSNGFPKHTWVKYYRQQFSALVRTNNATEAQNRPLKGFLLEKGQGRKGQTGHITTLVRLFSPNCYKAFYRPEGSPSEGWPSIGQPRGLGLLPFLRASKALWKL